MWDDAGTSLLSERATQRTNNDPSKGIYARLFKSSGSTHRLYGMARMALMFLGSVICQKKSKGRVDLESVSLGVWLNEIVIAVSSTQSLKLPKKKA